MKTSNFIQGKKKKNQWTKLSLLYHHPHPHADLRFHLLSQTQLPEFAEGHHPKPLYYNEVSCPPLSLSVSLSVFHLKTKKIRDELICRSNFVGGGISCYKYGIDVSSFRDVVLWRGG
jgi:hypothetical protein